MPFAFWCLLITMLMPFIPLFWVKREKDYDNAQPRAYYQTLTGVQARAMACHQNHLEALLFFAVAFFTAVAFDGSATIINFTSLAFVLCRSAYTAFYILDKPTPRSLAWLVGFISILVLFLSPAFV